MAVAGSQRTICSAAALVFAADGDRGDRRVLVADVIGDRTVERAGRGDDELLVFFVCRRAWRRLRGSGSLDVGGLGDGAPS